MPDRNIQCVDCGNEFAFSEGEQKFYTSKGLTQPKRCKKCRQVRREARGDQRNPNPREDRGALDPQM